MKTKLTLSSCALTFLLLTTGCQESQSSEHVLRLQALEQKQADMATAVDKNNELLSMKLGKIQKDIAVLEEHLAQNKEQTARLATLPEKLVADADANRIYLKNVRDNMGDIRTQTAKIVRLQNERLAQERAGYMNLMDQEIDVLSVRLAQMRQIAEKMKNTGPTVDKELERATSIISGGHPSNQPVAKQD